MDTLKVTIDAENNTISVMNNGRGIPIQVHKEEQIYVPELIFGHLLTSSNYNDTEKKVTGGRNGFGAKLCNIFSTEFIVETADRDLKLKYKQIFSKNMSNKGKPNVSANKKGEAFTKITFKPDLSKFNMSVLDKDTIALLKKRVYDMAGCLRGVKVYLNDERLKIRDFKSYINMYVKNDSTVIYEQPDHRWEVAVSLSDEQFRQMSFVNSICTSKGGTHVDYVTNQIVNKLSETVRKKNKSAPIKPFQIKNHLWVFVNCLIENPSFDSQTKENMTLRQSAFGSKCNLSEDFMKKVLRSGVLDKILSFAASKQDQLLKKTDGKKNSRVTGIVKLDDANNAGTRNAKHCTLILTEGDSAKALAVSGLSVIGRDNYGVFPLRGKLLNVRDAPFKTVSTNQEIQHLKQILGLQQGKVYSDSTSLRYGHLMIMTDQDHDGSHIKGLIINFFDHFWPSLLKIPGFLCEFITPIVKCTKKKQEHCFYTIPEYEQWRENHDTRGWTIKYYKGLGTSTREEAKKYFSALGTHRKPFDPCTDDERQLIDMAFNKKKADERKQWLASFNPGTFMDHSQDAIPLNDFINKELILFSIADNHRSIPSVVDGLKPGQRKILFACFKRKLKAEIKVAQLSGYVSEHSAYHHGEQSLSATIVNMAQDFVGSNNINLLEPRGQFGTRLQGGQDAASARYIFTTLAPMTRKIFHPSDDALLTYLNDDGQSIEPEWYIPVLPLVLINGSQGIGTGWSSTIPNYNPLDIVDNIRRIIGNEHTVAMHPWYKGFKGVIEAMGDDRYKVNGIITRIDDTTLEITELPVGVWTQTYKAMLEEYLTGEKPSISDYKEYHTDTTVHFIVTLTPETAALDWETLEKRFKFSSSISTSNMVCFDEQGRIKRYSNPLQILEEFCVLRLKHYSKRKDWLTDTLLKEFSRLENKTRFIREVVSRSLILEKKKRASLCAELRQRGYLEIKKTDDDSDTSTNSSNSPDEEDTSTAGYDYLLSMPLYSLTEEKIASLEAELKAKKEELEYILSQTPQSMWNLDLDEFLAEWESIEQKRRDEENGKGRPKGGKTKGKRGNTYDSDSSEEYKVAPKKIRGATKTATKPKPLKKPEAPKQEPTTKLSSEPDQSNGVLKYFKPKLEPGAEVAVDKKPLTSKTILKKKVQGESQAEAPKPELRKVTTTFQFRKSAFVLLTFVFKVFK
jgi:DNA topoisomerase-2